jgi:hypothetical protein
MDGHYRRAARTDRTRRSARRHAASPERPAPVVADVDLAATRDKSLSPRNDALEDRRPTLYR